MILVTGADGQLGNCLRNVLYYNGNVYFADKQALDVTNEAAVRSFIRKCQIDIVINCAAYTAVDKAEGEQKAAYLLNAEAPRLLAKYGRKIIHISTDYVFDGTATAPIAEGTKPNPLNIYGKTKLAGEKGVMANADTAVIIRTSWLYSKYGDNFLKRIYSLGAQKPQIPVVSDQIGTPTNAMDLARVIYKMLPNLKFGTKEIYHFSGEGQTTWYDFATKIIQLSNLPCKTKPITAADYSQRAKRPTYSVMDKSKIKAAFGIEIPHWEASLAKCMTEMKR